MRFCMDWQSVKFDWNRARAFLVTAEEGSLSAAARALGMTQPTLGRQVTALEQELGVVLFERGGHGLVPTPSGLELVEHVRVMADAANRVSLTASGPVADSRRHCLYYCQRSSRGVLAAADHRQTASTGA